MIVSDFRQGMGVEFYTDPLLFFCRRHTQTHTDRYLNTEYGKYAVKNQNRMTISAFFYEISNNQVDTMKIFFKKLLMIIGGLTVFMFFLCIGSAIFIWKQREKIPDNIVLELDFSKGLAEYVPDESAARMMLGKMPTVLDVVQTLELAAKDKRVAGIIADVGHAELGFARIQEIRNAVMAFRKKGKSAVAYTDTFGEFGPGNGAYYLATAFEEISLQPSGDLGLTGLMLETRFFKGTLEKLGVIPRMGQRHEYKNAMNLFTESKYTEPHKEAMEAVMNSVFGQMVAEIATARNLSEENVRSLTDHGLFMGQEAVNAGLADHIAYRDGIYKALKKKIGNDVQFIPLSDYMNKADRLQTDGEAVALIYGVGRVQRGKSEYSALSGDVVMGSETVAEAFQDAIEDDEVKAIVFRIDSPGGSYVASDSIWRQTVHAKEAGKPVIVSMSDVAGSGGYFVAAAADKIVAQPATITGSIGVLGGKMLTAGLWEKAGISWDEVHSSENATIWSTIQDYTPAQWTLLQSLLDRIYADFTGKVAQGRNLPPEKVSEIARGRIWTGADAKSLGLVDELGGFPEALKLAKKAAGISEHADIYLKIFPEKKLLIDILLEEGTGQQSEIREISRLIRELGLAGERGVLSVEESKLQ